MIRRPSRFVARNRPLSSVCFSFRSKDSGLRTHAPGPFCGLRQAARPPPAPVPGVNRTPCGPPCPALPGRPRRGPGGPQHRSPRSENPRFWVLPASAESTTFANGTEFAWSLRVTEPFRHPGRNPHLSADRRGGNGR